MDFLQVSFFGCGYNSQRSDDKYIRILKTIQTNIRIYLYQKNDTNEYTNIFVSKKAYERIYEYIRIKKMQAGFIWHSGRGAETNTRRRPINPG